MVEVVVGPSSSSSRGLSHHSVVGVVVGSVVALTIVVCRVVILNTIVRQSSSHLLHSELSCDVVWGGAGASTTQAGATHACQGGRGGPG